MKLIQFPTKTDRGAKAKNIQAHIDLIRRRHGEDDPTVIELLAELYKQKILVVSDR